MGCDCQKQKKTKEPDCKDAGEIAYKEAFLKESKKFVQAVGEKQEIERRVKSIQEIATHHIQALDTTVGRLEKYLVEMWKMMPQATRIALVKAHGEPPFLMQVQSSHE